VVGSSTFYNFFGTLIFTHGEVGDMWGLRVRNSRTQGGGGALAGHSGPLFVEFDMRSPLLLRSSSYRFCLFVSSLGLMSVWLSSVFDRTSLARSFLCFSLIFLGGGCIFIYLLMALLPTSSSGLLLVPDSQLQLHSVGYLSVVGFTYASLGASLMVWEGLSDTLLMASALFIALTKLVDDVAWRDTSPMAQHPFPVWLLFLHTILPSVFFVSGLVMMLFRYHIAWLVVANVQSDKRRQDRAWASLVSPEAGNSRHFDQLRAFCKAFQDECRRNNFDANWSKGRTRGMWRLEDHLHKAHTGNLVEAAFKSRQYLNMGIKEMAYVTLATNQVRHLTYDRRAKHAPPELKPKVALKGSPDTEQDIYDSGNIRVHGSHPKLFEQARDSPGSSVRKLRDSPVVPSMTDKAPSQSINAIRKHLAPASMDSSRKSLSDSPARSWMIRLATHASLPRSAGDSPVLGPPKSEPESEGSSTNRPHSSGDGGIVNSKSLDPKKHKFRNFLSKHSVSSIFSRDGDVNVIDDDDMKQCRNYHSISRGNSITENDGEGDDDRESEATIPQSVLIWDRRTSVSNLSASPGPGSPATDNSYPRRPGHIQHRRMSDTTHLAHGDPKTWTRRNVVAKTFSGDGKLRLTSDGVIEQSENDDAVKRSDKDDAVKRSENNDAVKQWSKAGGGYDGEAKSAEDGNDEEICEGDVESKTDKAHEQEEQTVGGEGIGEMEESSVLFELASFQDSPRRHSRTMPSGPPFLDLGAPAEMSFRKSSNAASEASASRRRLLRSLDEMSVDETCLKDPAPKSPPFPNLWSSLYSIQVEAYSFVSFPPHFPRLPLYGGDTLKHSPVLNRGENYTEHFLRNPRLSCTVPTVSLDQIHAQACLVHEMLKACTVDIASTHGGLLASIHGGFVSPECEDDIQFQNMKGWKRCIDKASSAYGGDFSLLTDVCRQTIYFSDVETLVAAVPKIVMRQDIQIVNIKNCMDPSVTPKIEDTSHRFVRLNLRMKTPEAMYLEVDYHVCELLLVVTSMAATVSPGSHSRYTALRSMQYSIDRALGFAFLAKHLMGSKETKSTRGSQDSSFSLLMKPVVSRFQSKFSVQPPSSGTAGSSLKKLHSDDVPGPQQNPSTINIAPSGNTSSLTSSSAPESVHDADRKPKPRAAPSTLAGTETQNLNPVPSTTATSHLVASAVEPESQPFKNNVSYSIDMDALAANVSDNSVLSGRNHVSAQNQEGASLRAVAAALTSPSVSVSPSADVSNPTGAVHCAGSPATSSQKREQRDSWGSPAASDANTKPLGAVLGSSTLILLDHYARTLTLGAGSFFDKEWEKGELAVVRKSHPGSVFKMSQPVKLLSTQRSFFLLAAIFSVISLVFAARASHNLSNGLPTCHHVRLTSLETRTGKSASMIGVSAFGSFGSSGCVEDNTTLPSFFDAPFHAIPDPEAPTTSVVVSFHEPRSVSGWFVKTSVVEGSQDTDPSLYIVDCSNDLESWQTIGSSFGLVASHRIREDLPAARGEAVVRYTSIDTAWILSDIVYPVLISVALFSATLFGYFRQGGYARMSLIVGFSAAVVAKTCCCLLQSVSGNHTLLGLYYVQDLPGLAFTIIACIFETKLRVLFPMVAVVSVVTPLIFSIAILRSPGCVFASTFVMGPIIEGTLSLFPDSSHQVYTYQVYAYQRYVYQMYVYTCR